MFRVIPPGQKIRATYDLRTIRVYQAYSNLIAESALAKGTFVSPPFKLNRMTWIKPSFLWMMYRSGWGYKDENQARILAIDITREGFEWALRHGCLSHPGEKNNDTWKLEKDLFPVRIQWDPERDLKMRPQNFRTIQIGLGKEAALLYTGRWIKNITDITSVAHKLHQLTREDRFDEAKSLLPHERDYVFINTNTD